MIYILVEFPRHIIRYKVMLYVVYVPLTICSHTESNISLDHSMHRAWDSEHVWFKMRIKFLISSLISVTLSFCISGKCFFYLTGL